MFDLAVCHARCERLERLWEEEHGRSLDEFKMDKVQTSSMECFFDGAVLIDDPGSERVFNETPTKILAKSKDTARTFVTPRSSINKTRRSWSDPAVSSDSAKKRPRLSYSEARKEKSARLQREIHGRASMYLRELVNR